MQRATFFSAIPLDVCPLLVRYLSRRPHCEIWLDTVNVYDVDTVLKCGGALTAAAHRSISDLDCSKSEMVLQICDFREIISTLAPHLKSLHVGTLSYQSFYLLQFPVLRVLKLSHCANKEEVQELIRVCGQNLLELTVSNVYLFGSNATLKAKTIQNIACHCRSLQVLDIVNCPYDGTLEVILCAVGNTLRQLRGRVKEADFVHIARHCTRLEKMDLLNMGVSWRSTSAKELLKSVLTLRVLQLRLTDRELKRTPSELDDLRSLLAVCPSYMHIYSQMEFSHSDDCLDYIRVMGSRLRVLSMRCDFGTFPRDLLPIFYNLEDLSLNPCSDDFEFYDDDYVITLRSVFVEVMPNLRKLTLFYMNGPKILPLLARCVTSLTEFTCSLVHQNINGVEQVHVKGSDFIELFLANKQLRFILVDFIGMFEDPNTDEKLVHEIAHFIRHCSLCSFLKEIEIYVDISIFEESEKIRDACVPLRTKRVNVVVTRNALLRQDELIFQ